MLGIGDGLVFYKPGNLIPTPREGDHKQQRALA